MGLLGIGCALPSLELNSDAPKLQVGRVLGSDFRVTEYKCAARKHFTSDESFYCGTSTAATGGYGGVYMQGCGELPDGRTVSILWGKSSVPAVFSGCGKRFGIIKAPTTSTGATPIPYRSCAIDPAVIPYGTSLQFKDHSGAVRCCQGNDRGGAIKGRKLDLFIPSTTLAKTTERTEVRVVASCGAAVDEAFEEPISRDFLTVLAYGESESYARARINAQSARSDSGERSATFMLAVMLPGETLDALKGANVGESGLGLLRLAMEGSDSDPLGPGSRWAFRTSPDGAAALGGPPLIFFDLAKDATRLEGIDVRTLPKSGGTYAYLSVYFFRLQDGQANGTVNAILSRLRSSDNLEEQVEVTSRSTQPLYGIKSIALSE